MDHKLSLADTIYTIVQMLYNDGQMMRVPGKGVGRWKASEWYTDSFGVKRVAKTVGTQANQN
jgi:hypothetical protein